MLKSALHWTKEPGSRLEGSRDLDSAKLQAPCIVAVPSGGFRLFYTAVGPGRPYPACQGYILSAVSADGLAFEKEPGIRLAPRPAVPAPAQAIAPPPFQAPAGAAHFVGRNALLADVRGRLTTGAAPHLVALTGMGGIGKTALAVHLAHLLADDFPDGVLWAYSAMSDPREVAISSCGAGRAPAGRRSSPARRP